MNSIKDFVVNGIMCQPTRYAKDNGDLNLINDYFEVQGWQPLTREQHTTIAAIIRHRNYFLQENEAYDHRTKRTAYESMGQTSIYDYMDTDTAKQSKKLIRYWSADPSRFDQSSSRIKKSVRDVDDDHIVAAKIMYPLLVINPKLKQKRRQRKAPAQRALSDGFDSLEETNLSDEVADR